VAVQEGAAGCVDGREVGCEAGGKCDGDAKAEEAGGAGAVEAVEGQEQRALPAVLTIHWGWVVVAFILQVAIMFIFNWTPWYVPSLFGIWALMQAYQLLKLNRHSTALYWYLGCAVLWLVSSMPHAPSKTLSSVEIVVGIAALAVEIAGIFVFCWDMEWYFNEIDGTKLKLSFWMALFFNTLYFQYQFRRIAGLKKRQLAVSG
jgi:hypothetical protein